MRDAMGLAAAVFEPEELKVLDLALKLTMTRLVAAKRVIPACSVAKLLHNLGGTRVNLKKPLAGERDAAALAHEAMEHYAYLDEAPDAVVAALDRPRVRSADRIVEAFPRDFREPPVRRL